MIIWTKGLGTGLTFTQIPYNSTYAQLDLSLDIRPSLLR